MNIPTDNIQSIIRDESEKGEPVEIANIDLAEDEGQQKIEGAE